jgi:hypothetical protein
VLVDFGLARLRSPDHPAQSAGGTPMYMAPEQMLAGRVDARSDLFSIALVLLWLVTGWRRPNAATMAPTSRELAELLDDPHLREVIGRGLDADPAKRFPSARAFSAALAGTPAKELAKVSQETPILPFRNLAPLTEADRGRLQGRDGDVALITEHALYRRCVVYAAPSGSGKTSVLRAGLLPRLEALGIHAVYIACRTDFTAAIVKAISPGAASIADAITHFHQHRGGKLVIVVDQLETAVADPELVPALLGFDRWPRDADVSIVLAVREDYLARLLARTQPIEPNLPIVRLPPLSPAGARAAIVAPLAEARLAIEPALLDALLGDLQRAAAAIGREMGWGSAPAVFPPHLQLACSVLYEALTPDDKTLTLAHYRELGGFDAIVGEHLDRVIETELAGDGRDLIARDVFLALVDSANQRAIRPESELLEMVGAKHGGAARVQAVLAILQDRGLIVRVRGESELAWELVHDSLVPRVLAWVDRKDLARRRAIEVVRYHLRRSTKDAPSLLGRKELRELAAHEGAVAELEEEWSRRGAPDVGWTPSRLVARSRQVLVRGIAVFSSVVAVALLVGGIGIYRSRVEATKTREMERLKELDLGRFTLSVEVFDWDPTGNKAIPSSNQGVEWALHSPGVDDPDVPGQPYDADWLVRGERTLELETVEAHGGAAVFVFSRQGCGPTTIPVRNLPGYAQREHLRAIKLKVPSCKATRSNMVEIPSGRFVFGGVGEPVAEIYRDYPQFAKERVVELGTYAIDRTEVTNAQFEVFSQMSSLTGIAMPIYPQTPSLGRVSNPNVPVTGIDWREARVFCRFLGKQLPSSEQWTKALRGGDTVAGTVNPFPRRNFPWGGGRVPSWVSHAWIVEAGTRSDDVSPYGVFDLAANVTEWTSSPAGEGVRIVRGGNWEETTTASAIADFTALDNPRAERYRRYSLGMRCATAVE